MKKFALLGFTLVVCLMMALASVQAQEDTIINPGDTVNGTITADSTGLARYVFGGTAGAEVVITMSSNDFDAYLVLIDFNGNTVREDDDSGGRLNAQITVTIPEDGAYTIIATSLRAYRSEGQFVATGDFTLSLTVSGGSTQPVATPIQATPTQFVPTPTLAFSTPVPTPAQATPTPLPPTQSDVVGNIGYGESVTSSIPQNFAQQQYRFSANSGDTVEITLSSADFDSYLFLYDSAGVVLAQDDDGAGDRNARIVYTIPANGEYVIGADSFGNVVGINPAFGAFTLTLNLQGTGIVPPVETPVVTPEPSDDGVIELGETVNGNFSSEVVEGYYTFNGNTGDIVTIRLQSDDVDTYLILQDAEGNVIAENDDSGGTLNSQIGPFQLTEDAEYTIIASTYSYYYVGETVSGRFALSIEESNPTVIEYDDLVEGQLSVDGDTSAVYAFEGVAGDVVTIDLDTFSYALYVQILGPNGSINQSTGGGTALLGPVILGEDGLYVVIVNSYDLYEPSDFSFVVNTVEPLPITFDEPQTNTFSDENSVYVYTFDGTTGMGLDVTVISEGAVDTRITLTAPSGTVIASDDDSGVGFDPELMGIVLTEDGTYSLLVQPYITGDSGDFTVAVNTSSVMMLDEEALTIRLSDKTFRGVGIFEGVAGETVLLSVRVITGAEYEPYITVTQGEEVLAVQSIGSVKRLIIELEIPADGPVQVSVEDFNYGSAVIEFSIER
ncbi:MAG: pre-peptidase C-terminal domain-containing protein [Anaerolineae bacterium]|nr:pre-peptidase C-terminal domain-containing protein [Anaerolineae bacterium]